MSWQEDLSRLDQELAQGRLTADDYRRHRDELLAAANQGQQAQPEQPSPSPTPFPAAFRWEAPTPAAPAETTQVIRPIGQDTPKPPAHSAEATQVVRNNQQGGDGERTQVVRGGSSMNSPPQGNPVQAYPQQPQQWMPDQSSWYTDGPVEASKPVWATPGGGDWPKQGPEVFEMGRSRSGGKRIALIVVIALIVLGGVGFGVYSLMSGGGGTVTASSTANTPTSTTPPPPKAAVGSLVTVPGVLQSTSFTPDQLAAQKPLAAPDLLTLAQAKIVKADYVVSKDNSSVLDLWGFTSQDPASAKALATAFDADEGRFGFKPSDIKSDGGKYVAYTSEQKNGDQTVVVYRMHYVTGNQVIRVEAFDQDSARARQEFTKLLAIQTKLTPAD